jgi:hypothetical protein
MRSLFFAMSLVALSVPAGFAADIDYKLSSIDIPEFDRAKPPKLFSIEVKDREWITAGVQTTTKDNGSDATTEANEASFKQKVEAGQLYQISYRMNWPRWEVAVVTTSHWLEDEVWPRTKEAFYAERHRERQEAGAACGYIF